NLKMMYKKQCLWDLWLSGFSLQAFAQDPIAQQYAGEITTKRADKHLKSLSSDKFQGRETGQKGAEIAANYIAKTSKKLVLTASVNGSYLQEVPLTQTTMEVNSFQVNNQSLHVGTDFLFNASGAANTISANEIIFIGYGIGDAAYDDLKGLDIKGKVVMMIGK